MMTRVLRVCVCLQVLRVRAAPRRALCHSRHRRRRPSDGEISEEHDDYARAVALAGRARMAALDTDAVADFMAELLKQYAAKQVRVCVALSAPLAPTATGLHTQHCTLSSTYLHF